MSLLLSVWGEDVSIADKVYSSIPCVEQECVMEVKMYEIASLLRFSMALGDVPMTEWTLGWGD